MRFRPRTLLRIRPSHTRHSAALLVSVVLGLSGFGARAQGGGIAEHWGSLTSPVYGTSEPAGPYAGAELFAGPRKLPGGYFHGVLPNGRLVTPAGTSVQVGMNPLGITLTPDGKYLIVSNDDERFGSVDSLQSPINRGGYSLSVVRTTDMAVVAQSSRSLDRFFVGLQVTGRGPYTLWASAGPDNSVKVFTLSVDGAIAGPTGTITLPPTLPSTEQFVSHYTVAPGFDASSAPGGFSKDGAKITFPAGSALSPDGKFLYVACNGDNSVAVIDTAARKVVRQVPVGYLPYSVSVSRDGSKILVSNWGVTAYKFKKASYDAAGNLTSIAPTGPNLPDGFYVPKTDTLGDRPKTSSISVLSAPGGDGAKADLQRSLYEGKTLDALKQVGDTHPSATAIVRKGDLEILYVTKSNSDSLGMIALDGNRKLKDVDLSLLHITLRDGHPVHGAYPNALVVAPDNTRLYVAEAGINSVAVLDTSDPIRPKLLGRIPTGWYPAALAMSGDGRFLYIANAKGIGEDINPQADPNADHHPTGIESFSDSKYIFGSVQKVDVSSLPLESATVLHNNFAIHAPLETSIVPVGGQASRKIRHVFFLLQENKTFDSMLGNLKDHFGSFAGDTFNNADGSAFRSRQYTGVSLNTQRLALKFATAVNYFSDSEESDAGHDFASSGTCTDYSEKTLLVKEGRGLLVNKNMDPEDYPEGGYIFNNAARHGVSFKDYGDLIRIVGTDTGTSTPTLRNDPLSGSAGYPQLQVDAAGKPAQDVATPLNDRGDVNSRTQGMGQSYFLELPALAVLGDKNRSGEPHLDRDYPGYNFNISDQRRALEFCRDFDRMLAAGTLPQFLHIYLPNDHTGGIQAGNSGDVLQSSAASPLQQVADGDVALGMVVQHIMNSPIYYEAKKDEGSALFLSYDDAQSSQDHIHPHRTPLIVVSPFARPGYIAKKHYVTASIVKTEELLLGLPPNNYGDLLATDLRDLFQPTYNGITADSMTFSRTCDYTPSPEGERIWALSVHLDASAPDRDSARLGRLARLSLQADELHADAIVTHRLQEADYRRTQEQLYQAACRVVQGAAPRDADD
jgi:YVTN family beta-propeller protein